MRQWELRDGIELASREVSLLARNEVSWNTVLLWRNIYSRVGRIYNASAISEESTYHVIVVVARLLSQTRYCK